MCVCVCVSREVEEVMGQRVAQVNMELEMAKESNASLLRQLGSVKVCTMCVLMHTSTVQSIVIHIHPCFCCVHQLHITVI